MAFENLPKGSILQIEAKDLLTMATSGAPSFTYPGASTTTNAGGQGYSATVATRNGLLPSTAPNKAYRRVSEHNRSEFTMGHLRIEQQQRMANGSLRKYFVADKMAFNVSWSMLPSFRNETVDGGWGAEDLKYFYESSDGQKEFNIKISTTSTTSNVYTVVFTSCNFTIVKRGLQTYWNVDLSMEQV